MMPPYRIVAVATTAAHKIEAIIHGPGLEPGGTRHEFQTESEVQDFVALMNLAFEQGFKKGIHTPKSAHAGSPL